MLIVKILVVLAGIWVIYKVLWAKPKATEKVMENPAPPPEPKSTPEPKPAAPPPWTTFAVTFSEDTLTAMEQLRLITGAQNYKEVVYHALIHYDQLIRLKAEGRELYLKDDTTGQLILLTSEQMRTASYIKIPKA